MDCLFSKHFENSLLWMPERGIGYFPVVGNPYDEAYFQKYVHMSKTGIGINLLQFRLEFVSRHIGPIIDIGMGCGNFIEARNSIGLPTTGYDINPIGIKWLKDKCLWDDYTIRINIDSICLWDVLEHLESPTRLLSIVERYVFCSIPIFHSDDHILSSKHYRKNEHRWYFTSWGLKQMMTDLGFDCIEESDEESRIGRDSIGTFCFLRR